jgi:hypothetical protein
MSHQRVLVLVLVLLLLLLLQPLSLPSLADPPRLYSHCNTPNKFLPHTVFTTLNTLRGKSVKTELKILSK